MAHETSSDESADLFNLPEEEGAPPMGVCGRSVSAPATFTYEKHDPAEQRKNITTIIDRSMVVNGIGVSTAYSTVISGVDDEQDGGEVRTAGQQLRNGQRMQIVRMADGSEFALPAAPLSHLPHPKDREDWSLLPTPVTVNDPVDSSWIRQRTPIRNQSSQSDRYSSDDSFDRRFYPPNLNIFSPDEILVTEPERRSLDHPASDPGISSPNIGEWYWNHRTQNTSESASHTQNDVTSNHEESTLPEDGERPWDIVHPDVGVVSDSPITPALVDGQTNGTLADAPDQNVLNRRLHITAPIYEFSGNSAEQNDLSPVSDSQHESRVEPKTLDSATTSTNLDQSQAFAPGLINLSTSNKFSDARILLTSAFDCFPSQAYAVHRIMISRSSVLNAILERQTNLNTTILITAAKNFTVARGFEFALKRLYGLELLDRNGLYESALKCLESEGNDGDVPNQLDKTAMDLALCYGSAGTFLDCDDIVDASFNLVLEILSWSNLETAFQFGLYPDGFLLACQKCRYRPKRKNENHNSDFNSTDNSDNPKKGQNRRPFRGWRGKRALNKAIGADTHYADMAHSWTPRILSAAVDFLVQNLPSNYQFDRTGLAKDLDDRIPAQFRSEYSIANRNPVLASLAFGDHPLPTPECTHASAILLALPFERFREVIEGIRDRGLLTGDLIKTILQEREERRQTAVMKYTEQADPDELGPDVRSLGYGEFAIHVQTLEYDADSGEEVIAHEYSLHREWRGFHGHSSGSIIRDFGGIR